MRRLIDSLLAMRGRKLQTADTGTTAEGSRTDPEETELTITETIAENSMLVMLMTDAKPMFSTMEVTLLGQTGHVITIAEALKGRTARGTGVVT